MTVRSATDITARSAVEALRAGVPNWAAIRLLESDENALCEDFLDRLRLCGSTLDEGDQAEGFVIAGAFGAGKSHQLGYLGYWPAENFVVSLVPIQERRCSTWRGCLPRRYGAVVPDANDDVMTAVMARLHQIHCYEALEYWTMARFRRDACRRCCRSADPRRTPTERPCPHGPVFAGG
jgi:hypothetical protein